MFWGYANQVVSFLDRSDSNDDKVDPIVDNSPSKHHEQSICNVSFSNMDLGNLVNGWPGNPVE
jgi:hypothetical protein